jgi:uncharacterized membrane protein YhaH (DUF805 family)
MSKGPKRLGELVFGSAAMSSRFDFRLSRRLARRPYWIATGLLMGVRAVATVAALESPGWAFLIGGRDLTLIFVAALIGRRLRDFGRSAFWGWLALAMVKIAGIALTIPSWKLPDAIVSPSGISPAGEFENFVLLFCAIGLVGLIKGDPGANRYGPAPGGVAATRKQPTDDEDVDTARIDAIVARALAERSAAPKSGAKPTAIAAMVLNPSGVSPPVFGKRR